MAQQQNYKSTQQAQTAANAAADRTIYTLTEQGIHVPQEAHTALAAVGFNRDQQNQLLVVAMAIGAPLEALTIPKNVAVLRRAWNQTQTLGWVAGKHYFVIDYGEGQGESRKAALAYVPSIDALQHNVFEHARLYGQTVTVRQVSIMDKALAKELFEYALPAGIMAPNDRVAKARVMVVGESYGPDENWQIGIYVHSVDGSRLRTFGRKGPDVALSRALRRAYRDFSRIDYPIDNDPVDVRIARTLEFAEQRVLSLLDRGQGQRLIGGRGVALPADVIDADAEEPDAEGSEERSIVVRPPAEPDDEVRDETNFYPPDEDEDGQGGEDADFVATFALNAWRRLGDLVHVQDALAKLAEQKPAPLAPEVSLDKLRNATAAIGAIDAGAALGGVLLVDLVIAAAMGLQPGSGFPSAAAKWLWDNTMAGQRFNEAGEGYKLLAAVAELLKADALAGA